MLVHQTLKKVFKVTQNIKTLKFDGDWEELRAIFSYTD